MAVGLTSGLTEPNQASDLLFVTFFMPAIAALAKRVRSSPALRLLLFLVGEGTLDFERWRQLNQVQLAEDLGTGQGRVSEALKELLAVGVLERRGRGPRTE